VPSSANVDNDEEEQEVACGRRFASRHNLDRHLKSHTGQKSHACDLCNKTFVDSTRLKRHKWIHSGHTPYKCQHCNAGFRHLVVNILILELDSTFNFYFFPESLKEPRGQRARR
jgi:uncharacterized Zn-finger protein